MSSTECTAMLALSEIPENPRQLSRRSPTWSVTEGRQELFSEIKNRGVEDAFTVVCDGMTGLPEAVKHCVVAGHGADLHLAPDAQQLQVRGPEDLDKISRALKIAYRV